MRLALLVLLALPLAGCTADLPSATNNGAPPCLDARVSAELGEIRPGETATIRARFENCGRAPIMYQPHCGSGARVSIGEEEYDLHRGAALRPPACATVVRDPVAFAPGDVHEGIYTWNGTFAREDAGFAPAPPGVYTIHVGFATGSRAVEVRVLPVATG